MRSFSVLTFAFVKSTGLPGLETRWSFMTIQPKRVFSILSTLLRTLGPMYGNRDIYVQKLCCWLAAHRCQSPVAQPWVRLSDVTEDRSTFITCHCTLGDGDPKDTSLRIPFTVPELNRIVVSSQPLFSFDGDRVLLASSRIGSHWQELSDVAAAVRSYLAVSANPGSRLVTGTGLACQSLTINACQLFSRPCIDLILPKAKSIKVWSKTVSAGIDSQDEHPWKQAIYLSPLLESGPGPTPPPSTHASTALPLVDRIVFEIATEVRALFLRPKSNSLQLMQIAATFPVHRKRAFVYLPSHAVLSQDTNHPKSTKDVTHQLMQLGAIGWYVSSPVTTVDPLPNTESAIKKPMDQPFDPTMESSSPPDSDGALPGTVSGTVSLLRATEAENLLAHHTRATHGKWPEETDQEYWLRWLTSDLKMPGAMMTLFRIVSQQRLRACGDLIPGSQPMVCFSQRSPFESFSKRQFRSHLGRWDYEPFGIAIDRQAMIQSGAQPVEYVQHARRLHPFQQKRFTHSKNRDAIDWSNEREYRLAGDLHLNAFDRDSLLVFVQTLDQAKQIAPFSRWPVKYLLESPE